MTTSTNNDLTPEEAGGAFADGLTIVRLLMTPIIMFVIYKAWSSQPGDPEGFISLNLSLVLLASVLFAIAAFTDLMDDYVGGSSQSMDRKFGWFDDIADSVLVSGTLIALMWVTYKAGLLNWTFALPACVLIGRDIFLAVTKGYEMSKMGFNETRLGDIKSVAAMLATCLLVAAPWLSNIVDGLRAGSSGDNVMKVYDNASPMVWNIGLLVLWIAAILAVITAAKFFSKPSSSDEDK
jgi:phosphatidylglycerophosphate synthase